MKEKIIGLILLLIIIIGAMIILHKDDEDFMKSCTEAGYSVQHCEAHK